MKVIVIGGTGTIGSAVVDLLKPHHEVIVVGHSGGPVKADIEKKKSIRKLLKKYGPVDAIVCTAGRVEFDKLDRLTDEEWKKLRLTVTRRWKVVK